MIARIGIAVVMAAVAAAAAPAARPAPGLHAWSNSIPRAFLKDRHLRLYSGTNGEPVLFKAGWQKARVAAERLCAERPLQRSTNSAEWFELRRLYTKTFDRQIRRAELEAIDRARNHVFLENSYLYNNQMILALVKARLRGVDVRVIMPGENDFAPGHSSNLVTSNFLRRHGVRVYFYPGMSHVKALLVDGWVCFGSANFDALSLRLNREANLATSDAGFAARFRREVFDTDFAKARELKGDIAVDWSEHVSNALLNPF